MKKTIIFIFILLLLLLGVYYFTKREKRIYTPNASYTVSIAKTEQERSIGLSYTKNLEPGSVKLFIFDKPDMYGFWMKDMLYPIDIVFLDENMQVVSYIDNAKPQSYPEIFYPESDATYVIEMNIGERERSGLYKGTKVYYK